MQKPTRQAFSPLVRFDHKLQGVFDKGEHFKDRNEMQKSTQQLTLSIGQALSPLVRIDYKLRGVHHDKRQNF